ncbi:hypothetical protein H0O00_03645 [Candidatus Micrarchaeota archaeon]|nr:hypothetical protein [Candidatus Micrarchaeota archaeon]
MERIGTRMSSLMRYRDMIDDSEKEIFDMLMVYAGEVATTIEKRRMAAALQAHC